MFFSAVFQCRDLVNEHNAETLMRITSSDKISLLESLIQNPWMYWSEIEGFVAFITKGDELAILHELAYFFSNLPKMQPNADQLFVLEFLAQLIPMLPSDFCVPRGFDLSATLALLADVRLTLRDGHKYDETVVYYLDHGGFKQLSGMRSVQNFFESCVTNSLENSGGRGHIRGRAIYYLQQYQAQFIEIPPLSKEELSVLNDALMTYVRRPSYQRKETEDLMLNALQECNSLIREGRTDSATQILGEADFLHILPILIQTLVLPSRQFLNVALFAMRERKLEYLQDLSMITWFPLSAPDNPEVPMFELLADLVPQLPSDFNVPGEVDLTPALSLLTRDLPDSRTWRRYSDALIFYLDHGAFDVLPNPESARNFLELCDRGYSGMMVAWNKRDRTSQITAELARFYLEKLGKQEPVNDIPLFPFSSLGPSADLAEAEQPVRANSHFRSLQLILAGVSRHIRGIVRSGATRNEVHNDVTELLEV
ncbi:hypothetical protein SISSUDRAFT_710759 [Sistotremastrum suecicum HHB10207 ss-3]|uniref:Uncharacterized protein n=1 Tax=Sistotremastrum suecicum HHB10207 ss-3 TaxID=1314776 RepID=A0A166DRS3_9AGAM|nr:hypothetical protein SISSUDRAFT_710759 [Sistotremastrum suecicum HHB10207 ss-3]